MDREQDPLKIPEILGAIFDADIPGRYPMLASACLVNKLWRALARERLYAKIDLSVVLRLLPEDAWYIYDDPGDGGDLQPTQDDLNRHHVTKNEGLRHPTLTLRRAITQHDWATLSHLTEHVHEIVTIGDYTVTEDNQGVYEVSEWGQLALNQPVVYGTLAACLPYFCLFPRLHTLYVTSFGGFPGVLRLFFSPELRAVHLEAAMYDFDAAICISAFVDERTGICPVQYMTLNHKLDSSPSGTLALAEKLLACTTLRELAIDYIDPLLWPSIALLPSLQKLEIKWSPRVIFGRRDRESDEPEFEDYEGADEPNDADVLPSRNEIRGTAFPALKTLIFASEEACSLTGVQLRTILEMRDAPWALEKLDIPFGTLDMNFKYSARTIFRYLRDHIQADTLTHLTLGTLREWRRASMGYNPLSGISELFGFSQLTVLRLFCFFHPPQSFEPLDAAETQDIARSFPRLRELQLAMPILPSEIGVFALHCRELQTLALCPSAIDPDTDLSELVWQEVAPAHTGPALRRFGICTEQMSRPDRDWIYLRLYARSVYPNAMIRQVPELLSIVLDFVVEDGYDHGIRSACYVARCWRSIAEERLWAQVDLSIVLRKLPDDAWYIYDTLRRVISQADWAAILPKTGLVRTMQTVGGPSGPAELLSKWGRLALAPVVYDMLAASIPNICLFPHLHSLSVRAFGRHPNALRLFLSPQLHLVQVEAQVQASAAAASIAALIDPTTGVSPVQEMMLNHRYGSSDANLAVLAVNLSACTALRRLTIEYMDPLLWPSVALLPSLEELTMRWRPEVTFGYDVDIEDGVYDSDDFDGEDPMDDAQVLPSRDQINGTAFPALKSLVFPSQTWGTFTFTQFRTILEMRDEPWALEKLVIPDESLRLRLKYSARTLFCYIQRHIRADTLTHLSLSSMWEWRQGGRGNQYDYLSCISELFGFSQLTVLHLRCFYWESEPGEFKPLSVAQTRELARSFPRLRDLLLAFPFRPTEIGVFAQYCPDLRELRLNVQFYSEDAEEMDADLEDLLEQLLPPAHQGVALECLELGTEEVQYDDDREELLEFAQQVYPNATIREVRRAEDLGR
ncbi:uncharacterized protein SCHCODRAFT_02521085 [Schizophyllum commune H4-8]|uniref:F-box domain-containing protein n=1 Tax=Schizophyllum commune (strain H4-8 / FGSC 9210) TaxID=578458 RepID=D8QKK9_SCHCM|nr:uncharacterized protein SCHCODRAFT_02521085 [Schizophyllum commune H4-8]KAI5885157.1 hypothetical protein SCHCODRAFT_02521085 [Schizophyllum commune H4-8]